MLGYGVWRVCGHTHHGQLAIPRLRTRVPDAVLLAAGVLLTLVGMVWLSRAGVGDAYVTLEVSNMAEKSVEVLMQKASVTTVLPKGTIKAL